MAGLAEMDLEKISAPTDSDLAPMSVDDLNPSKGKTLRASVSYENNSGRFVLRKKQFTQQYSHVRIILFCSVHSLYRGTTRSPHSPVIPLPLLLLLPRSSPAVQ